MTTRMDKMEFAKMGGNDDFTAVYFNRILAGVKNKIVAKVPRLEGKANEYTSIVSRYGIMQLAKSGKNWAILDFLFQYNGSALSELLELEGQNSREMLEKYPHNGYLVNGTDGRPRVYFSLDTFKAWVRGTK